MTVIDYLKKKTKEGRVALGTVPVAKSPRVGKVWQQERDVSGHLTPTVRKQRVPSAYAQPAFSFVFGPGPQSIEWWHPHSKRVFPTH